MSKYTRNVGKKFNADGTLRRFPGNTIICHVPKESPVFSFLVKLKKEIQKQPWSQKIAFLPEDSYHMTVFEGVCDDFRDEKHWTNKLPLDASLEDVDQLLIDNWNKMQKPNSFSMKYSHISLGGALVVRLKPVSPENNQKIREFRDLCSKTFGIKNLNHKVYQFHNSLGYLIEKLTFLEKLAVMRFIKKNQKEFSDEYGILETNEPELCFFEDMGNFAHSRDESLQSAELRKIKKR